MSTRLEPLWCGHCGGPREADHTTCERASAWEPPRYCARCRRRMKVQVLPQGWTATCVEHGSLASGDGGPGGTPAMRRSRMRDEKGVGRKAAG